MNTNTFFYFFRMHYLFVSSSALLRELSNILAACLWSWLTSLFDYLKLSFMEKEGIWRKCCQKLFFLFILTQVSYLLWSRHDSPWRHGRICDLGKKYGVFKCSQHDIGIIGAPNIHTAKGFGHSGKGSDAWTAHIFIFEEIHSILFRAAQTWRKSIKANISEAVNRLPPSLILLLANVLLCCIINLHGEAESWEFLYLQSCSF